MLNEAIVTALLQTLQGIGIAAGFVVFMYLLMWLMSRGDYDYEGYGDSMDEAIAQHDSLPMVTSKDLEWMNSLAPQDISNMTLGEWEQFSRDVGVPIQTDFTKCVAEYIATGDQEWLELALSELEN
jgi:hypothetical protein